MFNVFAKFHTKNLAKTCLNMLLIGLLIALGAIAGMGTLATSINAEFVKISSQLS